MFDKIFTILGFTRKSSNNTSNPEKSIEIENVVKQIRAIEKQSNIAPGKRIYDFEYRQFTVSLDREFNHKYRVSVFLSSHKIYGFSIARKDISKEEMTAIFDQIISFLSNEPSHRNMPESKLFKAHFFGNPE
ncbi:MAG: hypothetical protein PVI44_10045 [Balneolaceae bacterium]|jgi:hypothetical protein